MKKKFLFQVLIMLFICSVEVLASNTGFKWESGGMTMLNSIKVLSFILGCIGVIALGLTFMFGTRDFFHKMLPVFGGLAIIGSAGTILTVFGISPTSGLIF